MTPVEILNLFAFCLLAAGLITLWKRGASFARHQAEIQQVIGKNQAMCLGRIGQIARAVESLESSSQNTEDRIGRALNRSIRSEALHLLGSGMSPDTVASTLRVAKREVGLIAVVAKILMRVA